MNFSQSKQITYHSPIELQAVSSPGWTASLNLIVPAGCIFKGTIGGQARGGGTTGTPTVLFRLVKGGVDVMRFVVRFANTTVPDLAAFDRYVELPPGTYALNQNGNFNVANNDGFMVFARGAIWKVA